MTITELAIKRPTLVVVLFSVLGVLGIYGFIELKYDLMPKMTAPVITITTIYPGASPNEVENSVTKPIEDAITGIDQVAAVRSTSFESRSFVSVEFEQSTNVNFALQDVQRKVNEIADKLPLTAKKPVVSKISFDEIPVLRMSVRSSMPSKDFYQFVKEKIVPRISKNDGVGMVSLLGGEEREIKVQINQDKLRSIGLSPFLVAQTIKSANLDFPTGKIKDENDQYVVRVAGKFSSVDSIRNLVVSRTRSGGEIKMKDIADVEDAIKETYNINRLNGIPSVGILVQKASDANTVDVSKLVRKEIAAMEKDYADINLKFEIAQDASTFIMSSSDAVKEDLLLAILLVAVVMLVFLHSLRNSLIVLVAIPSSLVSTFFIMYIFGFTLNLMTLLAMSLVIGILVDDSIVVLENIYRHLEKGEEQKTAALNGRNEIGFAALSITLVDVVVFLPLSLITGMIGNFLREYALVVVFSTLMSLLVSFTITPMLASRFTKLENLNKKTIFSKFGVWFENLYKKITNFYTNLLQWSLRNGGKVVIISVILLIISISLFPLGFIGFEFIPVVDRGELIITIEVEPGASIEKTNQYCYQVEEVLKKYPVSKISTNVGASSEGFIGLFSNNNAEFYVTLVDKKYRDKPTDVIGQEMKKEINLIPGIKARVNPISLMGTSTRTPVQLLVTGPNYDETLKGAKIVEEIVKSIEGTSDVRLSSDEGKPELKIEINRDKLAKLGLTIWDIGQNLRVGLTGDDESKYREGVNEYDIRVQFDLLDRSKVTEVGNMTFLNNKGQLIQLKQFAEIYQSTGPTKLEREDRIYAINVYSQVYGKTSGVVTQEALNKLKNVQLPPGVSYRITGEQKNMMESMTSMLIALFVGILFVYFIMIALYNSYLYPFVVLFSIPLAIIGAFLGLALTMKSISVYSILGIIMLVGLVAKNAILLVDRTNQMKNEQGLQTYDALIEAGQTRLRPILMTTFAMVFGMLPIALSTSPSSEAKSGLAIVLIGGLLSSMFLTLILIPVVYQKMDKWKVKLFELIKKRKIVLKEEYQKN